METPSNSAASVVDRSFGFIDQNGPDNCLGGSQNFQILFWSRLEDFLQRSNSRTTLIVYVCHGNVRIRRLASQQLSGVTC